MLTESALCSRIPLRGNGCEGTLFSLARCPRFEDSLLQKGFRPLTRREPLEGEGHYTTELVFLWAMANKTHAGVSRALAKAARRQRTGQVRGALGNGQ